MKREELVGQPVLAGPEKIGIILSADLENDNIDVQFLKQGYGTFKSGDLLLLKPFDEISRNLQLKKTTLSTDDYKALFQVSLLQGFEQTIGNIATAIAIAAQNETVRALSLRTLKSAIEQPRDHYPER